MIIVPTTVTWHRDGKTSLLTSAEKVKLIEDAVMAADLDRSVSILGDELMRKSFVDSRCTDGLKAKLVGERYFVDTLVDVMLWIRQTQVHDADSEGFEVFPIIGSDSYAGFKTWHYWQDILRLSDGLIVVAGRAGSGEITENMKREIPFTELKIADRYLDISASAVRRTIADTKMSVSVYAEQFAEAVRNSRPDSVLVSTPIFDLVRGRKEDNGLKPYKINAPDWVTVAVRKNGRFLVETQYRYGTGFRIDEFPCGMVEKDETPKHAAQRELEEETGISVKCSDLVRIGCVSPNPAFMTNRMHYFLVDLDSAEYEVHERRLDEHESIDVKWLDEDEFRRAAVARAKTDSVRSIPPAMLLTALALLAEHDKNN